MARGMRFTEEQLAEIRGKVRRVAPMIGEMIERVDDRQVRNTPKKADRAQPKQRPEQQEGGSEHETQCAFFDWWRVWAPTQGIPTRLLFAIPNAGAGAQAGRAGWLKAEGVTAGVSDTFLAVARGRWNGLFIEFKHGRNGMSPEQLAFSIDVRAENFRFALCRSVDEAIAVVSEYLALKPWTQQPHQQPAGTVGFDSRDDRGHDSRES